MVVSTREKTDDGSSAAAACRRLQTLPDVPDINADIALLFAEIADRLASRCPHDFRIAVYRRGAAIMNDLLVRVDAIHASEGRHGLGEIAGLNQSLALSIERFLLTGHMLVLDRLRGLPIEPAGLPATDSAMHTSRGDTKPVRLSHSQSDQLVDDSVRHHDSVARRRSSPEDPIDALIGELLSIDSEYRHRAAVGDLIRIAPREFNASGEAWLPLLHTRRNRRHYTAAWSNSQHAHEAGMVRDWVVIHRTDHGHHDHWTVITSQFGTLTGRRIVRGLESRCSSFYLDHPEPVQPLERFDVEPERQMTLFSDVSSKRSASRPIQK